jgi:hypothetical protein
MDKYKDTLSISFFTIKKMPSNERQEAHSNFLSDTKKLLLNRKYCLALISYALAYSNSWGIMSLLDSFLEDNGFDQVKSEKGIIFL